MHTGEIKGERPLITINYKDKRPIYEQLVERVEELVAAGHLFSWRGKAVLGTSVHSTIGLEEYVRVRLEEGAGEDPTAYPVFGKSGMLSTLVKADGIVTIPMNVEGFSKGESVEVIYI